MPREEKWSPVTTHKPVTGAIPGSLLLIALGPAGTAARCVNASVEVRIPLVGGKVKLHGRQLRPSC